MNKNGAFFRTGSILLLFSILLVPLFVTRCFAQGALTGLDSSGAALQASQTEAGTSVPAAATVDKAANDSPSKSKGKVDVNSGYTLNVRSGPWGKIIGSLKKGASVDITGKQGKWYTIDYKGRKGFVHSDYINKTAASRTVVDNSGVSSGTNSGVDSGKKPSAATTSKPTKPAADKPADKPAEKVSGSGKGAPGSDKAVNWAMTTSKNVKNPNNGKRGPSAWSGYCLGHVNRSWSLGAGKVIPQLQKCCAKQAYSAMKSAGKLKPIPKNGPIPAGAPIFWPGLSKWGHVTISTGKVDRNGVPTMVDSHGTVHVAPISTWGKPAGYGVIPGTPVS